RFRPLRPSPQRRTRRLLGPLRQSWGGEKSDLANNMRLVSQLQPVQDRRAYYVAVLVYMESADDPCPVIAEGRWPGEIIEAPRGEHGFGYDPHFWLPDRQCTVAELDPAEKNRISHRARALAQLLQRLQGDTP